MKKSIGIWVRFTIIILTILFSGFATMVNQSITIDRLNETFIEKNIE